VYSVDHKRSYPNAQYDSDFERKWNSNEAAPDKYSSNNYTSNYNQYYSGHQYNSGNTAGHTTGNTAGDIHQNSTYRPRAKAGSVVGDYDRKVNDKLNEVDFYQRNETDNKSNKHYSDNLYKNEYIPQRNNTDFYYDGTKANERAQDTYNRGTPARKVDNSPSQSSEDSLPHNYMGVLNVQNNIVPSVQKTKNIISANTIKRTSNIPNIPIKNAKRANIINFANSSIKAEKSRFLQETACYVSRLQNSKEKIVKNKTKNVNEPKNFVTGKVPEDIFMDFPKTVDPIEDNFNYSQKKKYTIVPRNKPVKVINDSHFTSEEKISKREPRFIRKKDNSQKPLRKASNSSKHEYK